MSIEVKVPALPESIVDATVAAWHKQVGEQVTRDENLLDLETDKVVLEVPAPMDGILKEILFEQGATVKTNQILARIDPNSVEEPLRGKKEKKEGNTTMKHAVELQPSSPGVRRMIAEHNVQPEQIVGSGKEGRITKDDVLAYIETNREKESRISPELSSLQQTSMDLREERRVPMTRIRAKIAERLLQAQHNAAMLTTFNEVNLKAIVELRNQYKNDFETKHGVKLGFMSFFTKAVLESLKRFPSVNASIEDQEIIYHGYYDIGIAVSTERGLVVPVLRNVDQLSMADIEKTIGDFAMRARQGKLAMEDMQGGTFTITNGGVFGSLLATPIINPPQTAILGMHKIEERPIAEQGQVVIRPMMYVALSYDHRLIDGRESVQFLVSVKELLEAPSRLLLDI